MVESKGQIVACEPVHASLATPDVQLTFLA